MCCWFAHQKLCWELQYYTTNASSGLEVLLKLDWCIRSLFCKTYTYIHVSLQVYFFYLRSSVMVFTSLWTGEEGWNPQFLYSTYIFNAGSLPHDGLNTASWAFLSCCHDILNSEICQFGHESGNTQHWILAQKLERVGPVVWCRREVLLQTQTPEKKFKLL